VAGDDAVVYAAGTAGVWAGGYEAGISVVFAVDAYRAGDGSLVWRSRRAAQANCWDEWPSAVAIAPRARTLLVTGEIGYGCNASFFGYLTQAFATASGKLRWSSIDYDYDAPTEGGTALATSPDGRTVVQVGNDLSAAYWTVAWDPSSGDVVWESTYEGPGGGEDVPADAAFTPDGAVVVVTGASDGDATGSDAATIAYEAASGSERWSARYDGGVNGNDGASALAIAPDGSIVFVVGVSANESGILELTTIAYAV
jgi:hypothetical protein